MTEIRRKAKIADNMHLQFKLLNIIMKVLLIFICVMGISFVGADQLKRTNRYHEILHTQQQYYLFKSNVENVMNKAVNLIKGYGALFNTYPNITVEESEQFMMALTGEIRPYVRNIGILEDTTILYNYPYEENKSTIGTNLVTIESQKENILRVKNELVTLLVGPVDLIQGGSGYIVRTPLLNRDGKYWGQASIVLKADEINKSILAFAETLDIEISILPNKETPIPIIGDVITPDQSPLFFDNFNNQEWQLYVIPIGGWKEDPFLIPILLIGILIATIISYFAILYQKTEYKLGYALTHDILTDLYNRRYLEVVQSTLKEKSEKTKKDFGLLHMDVDNFKYINDTFGHLKGDEVLKQIGVIIKRITRKDELAFRIGGDEFLIMIPEIINEDELFAMRKRFENDFENEFKKDEFLAQVRMSIGVAMYPKAAKDFDLVLKQADKDMYKEKRNHKNQNREEEK